jgi:Predicted endonuclease containing a URI domain
MVYLIHFARPIGDLANPHGQAQHYMGYTKDIKRRMAEHFSGNGSALMSAVTGQGVPWVLAKVWEGGRDLERQLKRRHNHASLCPICKGEVSYEYADCRL